MYKITCQILRRKQDNTSKEIERDNTSKEIERDNTSKEIERDNTSELCNMAKPKRRVI